MGNNDRVYQGMRSGSPCPDCKGVLHLVRMDKHFEYKGKHKIIKNAQAFFCDKCGENFVTSELAQEYEQELLDFFKEVDGK